MLYATTARATTQAQNKHLDQHPHQDECSTEELNVTNNSKQHDYHHHVLKYSPGQNIILMFDGTPELSGSTVSCSWFYPPNIIVSPYMYFPLNRNTYRNGIERNQKPITTNSSQEITLRDWARHPSEEDWPSCSALRVWLGSATAASRYNRAAVICLCTK